MASKKNDPQELKQYIADIGRHPILSREHEQELAKRFASTKDVAAGHTLMQSNLRFVVKVAHTYRGYGLRLGDLIQEGNLGLMVAVNKFEPSRGCRLISYAVWWVRAYMQNYIMRSWSLVKLGTTQAQRKLFFRLKSERERLEREAKGMGNLSYEDIASALGVRQVDVCDMTGRLAAHDMSLDTPVSDGSQRTHLEQVAAQSIDFDQDALLEQESIRQNVREKVAATLHKLNDKERYIIKHRLMSDEPKTLQTIGAHFSISRERARQIESNVIRKMKVVLRERQGSAMLPAQQAA